MSLLDEAINRYGENKAELDSYKKICDEDNKVIKSIMEEQSLDTYTTDFYKVTKSVQNKDTLDEDKLINLLNNSSYYPEGVTAGVCIASGLNIVKTRPYVDMDALEDAIYKGLIPDDVLVAMDKCKIHKEVVTLRISKAKKKED